MEWKKLWWLQVLHSYNNIWYHWNTPVFEAGILNILSILGNCLATRRLEGDPSICCYLWNSCSPSATLPMMHFPPQWKSFLTVETSNGLITASEQIKPTVCLTQHNSFCCFSLSFCSDRAWHSYVERRLTCSPPKWTEPIANSSFCTWLIIRSPAPWPSALQQPTVLPQNFNILLFEWRLHSWHWFMTFSSNRTMLGQHCWFY